MEMRVIKLKGGLDVAVSSLVELISCLQPCTMYVSVSIRLHVLPLCPCTMYFATDVVDVVSCILDADSVSFQQRFRPSTSLLQPALETYNLFGDEVQMP